MLRYSASSAFVFLTAFSPFCALNAGRQSSVIRILHGPDQTIETQGYPYTFKVTWYFNSELGIPKKATADTKYYVGLLLLNLSIAAAISFVVACIVGAIPFAWRLYLLYKDHRREMKMLDRMLRDEN